MFPLRMLILEQDMEVSREKCYRVYEKILQEGYLLCTVLGFSPWNRKCWKGAKSPSSCSGHSKVWTEDFGSFSFLLLNICTGSSYHRPCFVCIVGQDKDFFSRNMIIEHRHRNMWTSQNRNGNFCSRPPAECYSSKQLLSSPNIDKEIDNLIK